MSDGFTGFPVAGLDFYDDLEVDNTKSFWEKHKAVYTESVRRPMEALCAELTGEFAPDGQSAKVFRPYRDVRFAKDKTPYKTHQGAFVRVGEATGWYVELSPRGVRTGGGFYEASGPRLAAFREAVAHDRFGPELEKIVRSLERKGFEIGGDRLKTSPRGYDTEHPRIELLRHRSLTAGHSLGFEPVIHTPEVLDIVRDDWRTLRPLVEWCARHAST
ncbi:DUF2461 domain-containing protein [Nocardioides sp. LMS-CY]|uniref:DUF2461 domain-containing protein n=1 Tax=Nocardioides sp. (strain LMS-CY) TaxID=2840457 RepID=UPI001C004A55|nr:DUF2461 domain-containing protein [Nocardioides sp. LMS-CY]QWF21919.1 DUF2461 domain-containing protein [Nocardioides sp. LMS-CY]